jgi:hypothetical protein
MIRSRHWRDVASPRSHMQASTHGAHVDLVRASISLRWLEAKQVLRVQFFGDAREGRRDFARGSTGS